MAEADTQKTLESSVNNIRAQGLSFNKDGFDVSCCSYLVLKHCIHSHVFIHMSLTYLTFMYVLFQHYN